MGPTRRSSYLKTNPAAMPAANCARAGSASAVGRSSATSPPKKAATAARSNAGAPKSSSMRSKPRWLRRAESTAAPLPSDEDNQRTRRPVHRSEEHTSELQSLMRISYAVFCLKKKKEYYSRCNNAIRLTYHDIILLADKIEHE